MSTDEKAELGTEEYITVGNTILENLVIVQKNPDYVDEETYRWLNYCNQLIFKKYLK